MTHSPSLADTAMSESRTVERSQWVSDKDAVACQTCCQKFTMTKRRHHCRRCGGVFCAKCCSEKETLEDCERPGETRAVRVCDMCAAMVRADGSAGVSPYSPGGSGHPDELPQKPEEGQKLAFLSLTKRNDDLKEQRAKQQQQVANMQTTIFQLQQQVQQEEQRLGTMVQLSAEVERLRGELVSVAQARDEAYRQLRAQEEEKQRQSERITRADVDAAAARDMRSKAFLHGKHHSEACALCDRGFSATRREHHCRGCFESVCADCSRLRLPQPGGGAPERHCDWCGALRVVAADPLWASRGAAECCSAAGLLHSRTAQYWAEDGPPLCGGQSPPGSPGESPRSERGVRSAFDARDPAGVASGLTLEERKMLRPAAQKDADWARCAHIGCPKLFSRTVRRHHCRGCGYIYCEEHCCARVQLPQLGYSDPQRICPGCAEKYAR